MASTREQKIVNVWIRISLDEYCFRMQGPGTIFGSFLVIFKHFFFWICNTRNRTFLMLLACRSIFEILIERVSGNQRHLGIQYIYIHLYQVVLILTKL